jgi:hypothetical protein
MNSITQVKKQVKAYIKEKELGKAAFFVVHFDNAISNESSNIYKLTKNQYLRTEMSNLIKKENLKFPLKTKQFSSQNLLQKHIITAKNPLSLIKINDYLILGKKTMSFFAINTDAIYYKLNIALDMLKFLGLLKHLIGNSESQSKSMSA